MAQLSLRRRRAKSATRHKSSAVCSHPTSSSSGSRSSSNSSSRRQRIGRERGRRGRLRLSIRRAAATDVNNGGGMARASAFWSWRGGELSSSSCPPLSRCPVRPCRRLVRHAACVLRWWSAHSLHLHRSSAIQWPRKDINERNVSCDYVLMMWRAEPRGHPGETSQRGDDKALQEFTQGRHLGEKESSAAKLNLHVRVFLEGHLHPVAETRKFGDRFPARGGPPATHGACG